MGTQQVAGARYTERLSAPPSLWAGAGVFVLVTGVTVYAVLGPAAGVLAAAAPAVALGALLSRAAALVQVADGVLTAGQARIPVRLLGPVRVLDAEAARQVRGPLSDPAGYHLIRGWVPAGVVADVVDPADPTPYWFVASRRPAVLAAAVEAARQDPPAR